MHKYLICYGPYHELLTVQDVLEDQGIKSEIDTIQQLDSSIDCRLSVVSEERLPKEARQRIELFAWKTLDEIRR